MANTRVPASLGFRASIARASLSAAPEPRASPPGSPGLAVPRTLGLVYNKLMRVLHLSRSLLVTQSDMTHEVCVGVGEPPERHLPSNFRQKTLDTTGNLCSGQQVAVTPHKSLVGNSWAP